MWIWRLDLEFKSWIARMRKPAIFVAAIKALQTAAPDDVATISPFGKTVPSPSTPW